MGSGMFFCLCVFESILLSYAVVFSNYGYISVLCIIATLVFSLLFWSVSKFSDFTNGLTLVKCEYSFVINLTALFWVCSNLFMFS